MIRCIMKPFANRIFWDTILWIPVYYYYNLYHMKISFVIFRPFATKVDKNLQNF